MADEWPLAMESRAAGVNYIEAETFLACASRLVVSFLGEIRHDGSRDHHHGHTNDRG